MFARLLSSRLGQPASGLGRTMASSAKAAGNVQWLKTAGVLCSGIALGSFATYTLGGASQRAPLQCEEKPGVPKAVAQPGKCYLVGAGPGASDLLTLRAVHILEQADVVVRDELMNADILRHCKPGCEIIEQGKRGGREESAKQVDINKLLVERCARGQSVVRLKGGDPYIYGRAHQEIDALNAAGFEWEVVPGITSAIAGPAAAGIPLTHRDLSRTVALLSGHDPSLLDFTALARMDTIVMLMATMTLDSILTSLVAAGRDASTPVAVVKWGTLPDKQEVYKGTIATIRDVTKDKKLSPSVVVVGKVAELAQETHK